MKKVALLLGISLILISPIWAQSDQGKPITISNIWRTYDFYPVTPSEFRWMADDNFYSVLEDGQGIARFSIEDEKKVDQILDFSELNLPVSASKISSYEFSADEQTILLQAEVEPIFRRSRKQVCMVVNRESKKVSLIHEGAKVTNPTFSSDASKLGFVYENNIYFTDLATGKETQVTMDGKDDQIINGLTDWVYEEEFAFVDAFKWSPEGNKVAFYRFDESEVKLWDMELAGSLYPNHLEFKYPKAGEDNAKVTIHIYDLEAKKTTMVDVGEEVDQYIPRIKWTNDNEKLAVMRMNRLQNKVDILLANATDGSTSVILTEESETYIKEPADDTWYFLSDSDDFLWRSERSGFMHIYRYNMAGELVGALTEGDWAVDELIGVDEENEIIYYTSTEDSPLERHLYRIGLDGKKKKKLTKIAGTHNVTASSAFNYFVDSYSNTTTPTQTELRDAKGKMIKSLEKNDRLRKNFARHNVADPSFFNFAYTPSYRGEGNEEISLNGFMIKPTDFDETKQYPVLMFVYGGPGSQEVMNAWGHGDAFNYMWFQMLAQKGYIVACVDNRGTGGRGRDFRAGTYANLGRYETMDQVAAAKYLGGLPYIDKERIGIWGWSYGGYMTSLCLTKGGGVFKMGIAVAPVTNWRFYDTIYTERYLKRPQENARGYDENSPINFADQLKGNLLVIHGTGDDNVHFQNTVEFTDALIAANKQFDVFFYPNRNHGIYGGNTRYHLYTQMTNYILENL